jgi:hypothetical protein
MTAHKNLIQTLNFRIENISNAYESALKAPVNKKKEANINFRTEVAFFVHFVKNNYLSKSLFDELLNYNIILDKSEGYISSIQKVIVLLKQISQLIKSHQDFERFVNEGDDGWVNPFKDSMSIKASLLLDKTIEINEFVSSNNVQFINSLYEVLVSVCERWQNHIRESDLTDIIQTFDSCRKELFKIEYMTGFQKEYSGANSAIRLNNVFNAIIPLHLPKSTNEGLFESFIVSGTDLEKDELYFNDCKKIKNHIIEKIDEGFSIDATIQNFITYMELYRKGSDYTNGEKQLQKEFELYLFEKGYFPLSEIQLKNARIDTLAVNESNAFLVEYKQIGWTDSKINLKTELNKITSSFIQTDLYSKRLTVHPGLQKAIYIIIFTTEYFIFKNGITALKYKDLTFNFYMVYLGEKNPSKIRKPQLFEIENIIKK